MSCTRTLPISTRTETDENLEISSGSMITTCSHRPPNPPTAPPPNYSPGSEISISRGIVDPKSKRSYNKRVLFRNTFQVDRPIILTGLSFCGPHKKHEGETNISYQISVRLQRSWIGICRQPKKYKDRQPAIQSLLTKKGEKMRVNFPQQEMLHPNVWYDIEFELIGPDTMHLKPDSLKSQYRVEHEGVPILVMCCLQGSCQMSDLHFTLPKATDSITSL